MTCKIDILQARDAGQIVAPLRLLEREHGHSSQYKDFAVGIMGYMRIVLDLSMFPVVFEWCSLSIHVMNSLIGLADSPTSIFSVSGIVLALMLMSPMSMWSRLAEQCPQHRSPRYQVLISYAADWHRMGRMM